MSRNDLVAAFHDTLRKAEAPELAELTRAAKASTRVYPEGYQAQAERLLKKGAGVIVEENTSFAAADRYRSFGKTAVLNFANPVRPGGGVQLGARAQEECLCRSSNLYLCLTASPFPDYYGYNASLNDSFYSDRLIYSPGVTVFKSDEDLPKTLLKSAWFQVDVITCAAPYLAERKYTNRTALKALFKGRIKNIFEAALDNGAAVMILGAFGCGAFENPPELVATAFREVIAENRYDRLFERIVFAIKKSADGKNYRAFKNVLCPLTVNCPVYTLKKISVPGKRALPGMDVRFPSAPSDMTPDMVEEWIADGRGEPAQDFPVDPDGRALRTAYIKWKVANPFYKKQFSVLGDSISTLNGYNPEGYKLFYTGYACSKAYIHGMRDTWWGKVIDYFGGELLVNNAWSGSRVTGLPDQTALFPSGCSDERTGGLHIGTIMPDVILVYLGTNDWAYGVRTGGEGGGAGQDCGAFSEAYRLMLSKLKHNYPSAEIFCCTLSETLLSSDPAFQFPYAPAGIHIEEYNAVIRSAVSEAGCRLIDLYAEHIPYDSIDGSHPNAKGMDTLALLMLRAMCGPEGAAFLGGDARPAFKAPEIVDPDPERTVILFFEEDGLRLYFPRSEETVTVKKETVRVGSGQNCDIRLDSPDVSDVHAVFSFSGQQWFLQDMGSAGGTRLNGTKLEPGKKYILYPDDAITVGDREPFIFSSTRPVQGQRERTEERREVSTPAAEHSQTGSWIGGRYQIKRLLAHNAYNEIYLAEDKEGEPGKENVLVKICTWGGPAPAAIRAAFLREAQWMRRFDHPAIPKLFCLIEEQDRAILVREYLDGQTLSDLLTGHGRFQEEAAVRIGLVLADVLGYLHRLDPPCIYCDMKPGNVILTGNGEVKLIDFGSVWSAPKGGEQEQTIILGTKFYAPPEQFLGQVSPRSDIYSLGLTLRTLLTGSSPDLSAAPDTRPVRQLVPSLSAGIEYILQKCTAADPADRYQSCQELTRDLWNVRGLPPKKRSFPDLFRRK